MVINGSICEIVEFKILKGVRKESSRVQTLDFSGADLVYSMWETESQGRQI